MARDLATFDSLMKRSPFSLPTPEAPPVVETNRFQITGAANWDGIQRIFVKDTNSQQPESFVVSSIVTPWSRNLKLESFSPSDDRSKSTARVINTETGEVLTINFADPPAMPVMPAVAGQLPAPVGGPGVVNPNMPVMPGPRPRRPRPGSVQPGMQQPGATGAPNIPINRQAIPAGGVPMGSVQPSGGSYNSPFTTVSATEETLPSYYNPNSPAPRRGDSPRVIPRSTIVAPTPAPNQ